MLLGILPGAQLVATDAWKGGLNGVQERLIVPVAAVGFHVVQPLPAEGGGRVGEILIDELFVQAHRLEQLGALVGLQGGHTHLGGDLQNARRQGLVVILYSVR